MAESTSKPQIAHLRRGWILAVAAPEVLARFDELGFEPYILSPGEFAKLVQRDIDTAKMIAASLGVKPQ